MSLGRFYKLLAFIVTSSVLCSASYAQQSAPQQSAYLDEKLDRLGAAVEDLQFRQQKMQQQLDDLQAQLQSLRSKSTVSPADLQSLDARIQASDVAHEKDKKAILDQLAKELSALSPGRAGTTTTSGVEGKDHVVQKGETLATIAKSYGVTVADIVKANHLANPDEIKVGQKLTIPK